MISEDEIQWLANGERGISSDTIFSHITGLNVLKGWRGSHPHDPDDMTRCIKLLERCPSVAKRFDSMREVSPEWARLVDSWPLLVAMLDEEIPGWRDGRYGSAPKLYARMRAMFALGGLG